MTLKHKARTTRTALPLCAGLCGLVLIGGALAEASGETADGSTPTGPRIGDRELMLITDDDGTVLDVMEYVTVGVDGDQLIIDPGQAAPGLAALRLGHAALPLAAADLANLPTGVIDESALLDQVQAGSAGFNSALPGLPDVYRESGADATVAEYQDAFAQLHGAYTGAGLADVEAQIRDLDQNGLSDVLLDVLDSGLAPPDFVEFWETFDQQPFLAAIDTAEGDFEALLDALMVKEKRFKALLSERGFTLAGFLKRLAELELPPAYLFVDALAYGNDPGAFIDWIMAPGEDGQALVEVPLTADAEPDAAAAAGRKEKARVDAGHAAWQVLGEMGRIGAPVDLVARMKAQGRDPNGEPQPAIDGGLEPQAGVLDPNAPGKPSQWSYDAKTYRLSHGARQLLSHVELDLDSTACAQYTGLGSAHGQFARQWQLELGIADGDADIRLHPSQQANRGAYLGGRETGDPADVLQISLERIPLAIQPKTEAADAQAPIWGGHHGHEIDLVITGDGWAYLLNELPVPDEGRLAPSNWRGWRRRARRYCVDLEATSKA